MNIIKYIAILFILMYSFQESYSCDCKDLGLLDSLQVISYENSDLVFYAELVDYDTTDFSYTFKILELFKGKTETKFIKGKYFDSCSKFPKDKCKWIVYADYRENNIIDISNCSISRSELNPVCRACYLPPPPLKPREEKNKDAEIDQEHFRKELKDKATQDFKNEIEKLRKSK